MLHRRRRPVLPSSSSLPLPLSLSLSLSLSRTRLSFSPLLLLFVFSLCLLPCLLTTAHAEIAFDSCNYAPADLRALRQQAHYMFDHAFSSYMAHAFPHDELRPLSCSGDDTFGGVTLSLIDTLDTLLLFGEWGKFARAVRYVRGHVSFDLDTTVSVFEVTIRVLGGLLSAHAFLADEAASIPGFDPTWWYPGYDDGLLYLAVDLADRMMPAFDTATGIPFGAIHLQKGVLPGESRIASTAGAGSLLLEFGTLSRYTHDPRYYNAAFDALAALHNRRAWTGLVGNHINIDDGQWTATESGVGGLIDSFYEYMLKGYVLFGDDRLWAMFAASYDAVSAHVYRAPWFLDADMWSGQTSNTFQSSLSAFFPGVQVLVGRLRHASETTRAHYSVWRKYGCLPEGFDVLKNQPAPGRVNYPLRPELAEALFYLHWATNDSAWIGAARNMLHSIEAVAKTPCGYAEIKHVVSLHKNDLMPSFLMSETLKYLFLLFVPDHPHQPPHWLRSGRFVFTTEAHPLPVVTTSFEHLVAPSPAPARTPSAAEPAGSGGTATARDGAGVADASTDSDDGVDVTASYFSDPDSDPNAGLDPNPVCHRGADQPPDNSGTDIPLESVNESASESESVQRDDGPEPEPEPEPEPDTSDPNDYRHGPHRLKCPRRAKWQHRLPCGYGMAGTDFPKIDVRSLVPETIAPDVEAQVQVIMKQHGAAALQPGRVFFGASSAYRVVRVQGHEVLFSKLDDNDHRLELRKAQLASQVCKPDTGVHVFRRTCNKRLFDVTANV